MSAQVIVPGVVQIGAVGAPAIDHEKRLRDLESIHARIARMERRLAVWSAVVWALAEVERELGIVASVVRTIVGH